MFWEMEYGTESGADIFVIFAKILTCLLSLILFCLSVHISQCCEYCILPGWPATYLRSCFHLRHFSLPMFSFVLPLFCIILEKPLINRSKYMQSLLCVTKVKGERALYGLTEKKPACSG